jgi:asparagine synthase (glutamine-hydrolysing)
MDILKHRGPDDLGFLTYSGGRVQCGREWRPVNAPPEVVLLHRRLSILDLSELGWQPMSSPDGRFWMVFNGEIYNFVELREQLKALGHAFRSASDSEVLLAAYAQWGNKCLTRLIGMFAFAVLDTQRKSLFLARDFFGIKPLYYMVSNGAFAFASEVKALLEFGAKRNANPGRLYVYLRYGISDHGAETLLSEIHQLPAGHFLEFNLEDAGSSQPCCYWRPETRETLDIAFEEGAQRLRDLFMNNVRLHLRSDVPVGVALSGGIDSSAILACMRAVAPEAGLEAFSYISDDQSISEEQWVKLAAGSAQARLTTVEPHAAELVEDLDALTWVQDQPFGSTSLYAQYCVFRAAKKAGIKVMLDGQGADEMLGGYRFFMAARLASLIRQGRWVDASRFIARCSRLPGMSKNGLFFRAMDYLLPLSLQIPARKLIGKELTPAWLNAEWFSKRDIQPVALNGNQSTAVLRESLCRTLQQATLPGLLRYEDRNSMNFSIESRVPFLTPEMADFLLSLPEEYILAADGTSKAIFRAAMRGLVPQAILERKDKIGFATPEEGWLRRLRPWVQRILQSEIAQDLPFLRIQRARAEWDDVLAGRRSFTPYVWRWLNLILWSEKFQVQWG